MRVGAGWAQRAAEEQRRTVRGASTGAALLAAREPPNTAAGAPRPRIGANEAVSVRARAFSHRRLRFRAPANTRRARSSDFDSGPIRGGSHRRKPPNSSRVAGISPALTTRTNIESVNSPSRPPHPDHLFEVAARLPPYSAARASRAAAAPVVAPRCGAPLLFSCELGPVRSGAPLVLFPGLDRIP
jgi:hypothetical protein